MSLTLQTTKLTRLLGTGPVAAAPYRAPTSFPMFGLPSAPGAALTPSTTAPSAVSIVKKGVNANLVSTLGGILGGALTGFASGGLAGAAKGAAGALPGAGPTGGAAAGTGHTIGTSGTAGGGCVTVFGQQFCLGGSAGAGSSFQAGGGTGVTTGGGGVMAPGGGTIGAVTPQGAVMIPRGYHVNKRAYWLKNGTHVPAHSRLVKNRRRNPLNPRALSHAMARMGSFGRVIKRFEKMTRKDVRRIAPPRSQSGHRAGCGCFACRGRKR